MIPRRRFGAPLHGPRAARVERLVFPIAVVWDPRLVERAPWNAAADACASRGARPDCPHPRRQWRSRTG
jgi:hypothetical protein